MLRSTSVEPKRRRGPAGALAPCPCAGRAVESAPESLTTYAAHAALERGSRKERTRGTVVTLPSESRTMARSERDCTAAERRRSRATRSNSACVGYVSTNAYLLSVVNCDGATALPCGSSSPPPPARGRNPPGTLFGRPR